MACSSGTTAQTAIKSKLPHASGTERRAGGRARSTFTQDTSGRVFKIKDSKFPDSTVVRWSRSPSSRRFSFRYTDTFIHKTAFLRRRWLGSLTRTAMKKAVSAGLADTSVNRSEGAGETGKPEPMIVRRWRGRRNKENGIHEPQRPAAASPALLRRVTFVLTHLGAACWISNRLVETRRASRSINARTRQTNGRSRRSTHIRAGSTERERAQQQMGGSEKLATPVPVSWRKHSEKSKAPAGEAGTSKPSEKLPAEKSKRRRRRGRRRGKRLRIKLPAK